MDLDKLKRRIDRIYRSISIDNAFKLIQGLKLDNSLKKVMIGEEETPIAISKDEVSIDGTLKYNGSEVITESNDVDSLNDLSDVTYSSGDLTITSLDTIVGDIDIKVTDGEVNGFNGIVDGASNKFFSFGGEAGAYSQLRMTELGGDSNDDYFNIYVDEHGKTTLSTVDAASGIGVGYNAKIELLADGPLELRAGDTLAPKISFSFTTGLGTLNSVIIFAGSSLSSIFYLKYPGDTADYLKIMTANHGATTISTVDDSGANAHLKFEPDGSFLIKEVADAGADVAGYGQLWIHDTTPNELCFTDDAGTDIVGVGKYHYETKVCNYYATATGNFIPLSGYIIERTSTVGQNEYIAMVAPYNGTIERIMWRSEIAQNGTLEMDIYQSADGTEAPGTVIGTRDSTINIADDTTVETSFNLMTSGTNTLTKGNIYAIKITSPSNPLDTNVTVVFKWDITS